MSLSTYLQNKLLDHAFDNTEYTPAAVLYLALYTSDPTVADSGTEVSGGSYARQVVTGAVSGNVFTADAPIDFPAASAGWGTVSHVGVRDALSGGNLLAFGALSDSKVIATGDVFRESALTITLN